MNACAVRIRSALRSTAGTWAACGSLAVLGIAGCNGSVTVSSEPPPANAPSPPPPLPPIQTGTFRDSSVSGLAFVSGQERGVTDADGRYTCETGTDVTFSVGQVAVGSAECTSLIMPPSLVSSGGLDDPQAVNVARFLQMLDFDGNPDNGIAISAAVQQIAATWAPVNFSTADLDAALVAVRSDAVSVDGTLHETPAPAAALAHLEASLGCAYSGAFAGSFAGDYAGAMVMSVGRRLPDVEFRPTEFEWFAFDARYVVELSGGGQSVVVLGARPTLTQPGSPSSTALTGRFLTPDRISGTWEIAHLGQRGTFELARLGDDSGTVRFVGRMGSFRQDGVIVLSLDDGVVTGEVFEVFRGRRAQVNGTLVGDVMRFDVTGQLLTTVAGTVVFDQDGTPLSVTGPWGSVGEFRAAACRLG